MRCTPLSLLQAALTERAKPKVLPLGYALVVLAIASVGGTAHAATELEVLDTYPAGDDVTLNRNQTFYVHLRYSTDRPIQIWVRPFFRGQPAHAGSNGSYTYTGSGEALGWFFMMSNQGEVDQIRVRTGDGTRDGSSDILTFPVHVTASDRDAPQDPQPEWLTRLKARDTEQQQRAYQAYMNRPVSLGSSLLVTLLMWVVLALAVCGVVLPLRALVRWRGGWRVAAAVPAALVAFVILRLILGVWMDPTSHNLWPFELLMVGGLSVTIMIVLMLLRKLSRGAPT